MGAQLELPSPPRWPLAWCQDPSSRPSRSSIKVWIKVWALSRERSGCHPRDVRSVDRSTQTLAFTSGGLMIAPAAVWCNAMLGRSSTQPSSSTVASDCTSNVRMSSACSVNNRAMCVVEQLPMRSHTTLGGAPWSRLNRWKSPSTPTAARRRAAARFKPRWRWFSARALPHRSSKRECRLGSAGGNRPTDRLLICHRPGSRERRRP